MKTWIITLQADIETNSEEFKYFYAHTQLYKDKALCFLSFNGFAQFIDVDFATIDKPNLELSILCEFYPFEIANIERLV